MVFLRGIGKNSGIWSDDPLNFSESGLWGRILSGMKVHICRNGQQMGPYTLDQIHNYLKQNLLATSDLAWCD